MSEIKVSESGQVFHAAPDNHRRDPVRTLGPKKLKGSKPRDWETRAFGECAAIVEVIRDGPGWAVHMACCQPVEAGSKYPYCKGHWPFQATSSTKELMRGLRKHL